MAKNANTANLRYSLGAGPPVEGMHRGLAKPVAGRGIREKCSRSMIRPGAGLRRSGNPPRVRHKSGRSGCKWCRKL